MATLLAIWLPAEECGKAAGLGPSTRAAATMWETSSVFLSPDCALVHSWPGSEARMEALSLSYSAVEEVCN